MWVGEVRQGLHAARNLGVSLDKGCLHTHLPQTSSHALRLTATLPAVTQDDSKFISHCELAFHAPYLFCPWDSRDCVCIPLTLSFANTGEDAVTKGRSLCCVIIQSPVLRVSWGPGAVGSGA